MLLNLQPRSALDIFGLLSITLSFPFVLRLIYEETILTWNQGWQMWWEFSVAHVASGCSSQAAWALLACTSFWRFGWGGCYLIEYALAILPSEHGTCGCGRYFDPVGIHPVFQLDRATSANRRPWKSRCISSCGLPAKKKGSPTITNDLQGCYSRKECPSMADIPEDSQP